MFVSRPGPGSMVYSMCGRTGDGDTGGLAFDRVHETGGCHYRGSDHETQNEMLRIERYTRCLRPASLDKEKSGCMRKDVRSAMRGRTCVLGASPSAGRQNRSWTHDSAFGAAQAEHNLAQIWPVHIAVIRILHISGNKHGSRGVLNGDE